ncbi:hypothetical protein NRB16_04105 [Pseudomonas sp. LJDD11]|uniref:hypothetical protein n=1 Tax=Pseudomonas sp. LJDD11 TaxID=2931984 RepID=UPI00211C3627|nr:hypothetical protein [Pseudomonas sp. LJDD11]MCQ9422715.1 hypothetical protein [Pseudomonas sp. LJDD11]
MIEKVIVTFTKAWRGYSAGEVAGFVADTASSLIGGGVATAYAGETAVVSVPLANSRKPGGKGAAKKAEPTKPAAAPETTGQDESGGTGTTSTTSEPGGEGGDNEGGGGGTGDEGPPADPDDEKP